MSKPRIYIITAYLIFYLILSGFSGQMDTIVPKAVKRPKMFTEHGSARIDNYHWLSNPSNPNVITLLEQENKYADKILAPLQKRITALHDELTERYQINDDDVPVQIGQYWYYQRYEDGQQYPSVFRKKGSWNGREELLFDQAKMAKNLNYFILKEYTVSNNNNQVAYSYDTIGIKQNTLRIMDIKTRKVLPDAIKNVAAKGIIWTKDDKAIYYLKNDAKTKSYRLMLHTVGTDTTHDKIIYEELDKQNFLFINPSNSQKFLFLNSKNYSNSETWYLDLEDNTARLKCFEKRASNIFYTVDHYEGDMFHIFSNYQAANYQLLTTPLSITSNEAWKPLIKHKPTALLFAYKVLKNHIITHHKEKGNDLIVVHNKQDTFSRTLTFNEENFEVSLAYFNKYAYNTDSIRLNYSSLTVQNTLVSYDLTTGKITGLKHDVVNDYNPKEYASKRVFIQSRDGVLIPISLVFKKSLFKENGTNPLLLTAYGAYGDNTSTCFRPTMVSLLNRGFVFAIAHVRGGSEMGNDWYENGKLNKKKNTFNDFIDCAHYLRDHKYGDPQRLFAAGGSAGGMLMGNVINQEPELFKGVVATVPWMDVLNDMMDDSMPLTVAEYSEWGNPNDKKMYDYMKSWSPYDNVHPANYPAIFTTGNLFDQNVPYSSPAKWVQKVRELSTNKNTVIFKCNLKECGHSGPSERDAVFKNIATQYAFLLNLANIKD